MGGAGGSLCLSEDAQEHIKDAIERWNQVGNMKSELEIRENQLTATCIALQQAGIIPMETDPDWMVEVIRQIPEQASLRSKALMKGENPRN